jgi:hypothetical protein
MEMATGLRRSGDGFACSLAREIGIIEQNGDSSRSPFRWVDIGRSGRNTFQKWKGGCMQRSLLAILAGVTLSATLVFSQDHETTGSKVTSTPQWERLKSLVGEWEGYSLQDGKKFPVRVTVRMTGDGSALMHWMGAGTPHEMVTMFHPDKEELLATHYCSAHNQPRFRAVPAKSPSQVAFEFMDGTNIRPGDGYMKQLVIDFVDADHHNEVWGFEMNGQVQSDTFYMTRVRKAAR